MLHRLQKFSHNSFVVMFHSFIFGHVATSRKDCDFVHKLMGHHCTLVRLTPQLSIICLVTIHLWQKLYHLALASCTLLERGLDSTSHHSHIMHCELMVADIGRIYQSSLQYCCMPPQSLHWPEWELHSLLY